MSTQDYEPGEHYPGAEDPYAPLPPRPEPPRRRSVFLKKLTWRDVILVLAAIAVMRLWVLQTVIVEGASMSPTLVSNEWVLVLKPLRPHRFSVVVLKEPKAHDIIVKRVVGLAGDKIGSVPTGRAVPGRLVEFRLEVNGVTYREPYAPDFVEPVPGQEIAASHYYVLGDNRNDSLDSRAFQAVPEDSLEGVAVAVVYPFSKMRILASSAEPIRDPQAAPAQ